MIHDIPLICERPQIFAEKALQPGFLVLTTGETVFLYATLNQELEFHNGFGIGIDEPFVKEGIDKLFVILSTIVSNDMIYCYMLGHASIGWLQTWEDDGIIELVEQCKVRA